MNPKYWKEYDLPTIARRAATQDKQAMRELQAKQAQILNPDWVYYSAADTDVQRTWRKFGWKPVQEQGVCREG